MTNTNFPKGHNTISRVVAKRDLQAMLKALKGAGMTVQKLDSGYKVLVNEKLHVLKAMNGQKGYLVRMCEDLFN